MSDKNYDVELTIQYDEAHKHYIPSYEVAAPSYKYKDYWGVDIWTGQPFHRVEREWEYYVSFGAGNETKIEDSYASWTGDAPNPYWNTYTDIQIPDTGVFDKVYFRNPRRNEVTFTASNCKLAVKYNIKAEFEVQFNSVGFAANQNPTFKCSTIQKNTYKQYEWKSAIVYYKKRSESTYKSVNATVSGTWSDVTVKTSGLTLQDNNIYDIYIRATSDDGTVATTPVGEFNTVDAPAVATCISPSGAFINGDCTFIWNHSTAYGTPQYAYDLQYSMNNGGSWVTVASHRVTTSNTVTVKLTESGVYIWRVRTYNSNNVAGEWGQASFVNNVPVAPPTNLSVNTKGRPTVSWAASSQSAYQVQFMLNGGEIVYDSGAVYSTEKNHFVNKYFDDSRSYIVRLRIYNALGEISNWVQTGYQQPSISDVVFEVTDNLEGGAIIKITPTADKIKYYVLRDDKIIGQVGESYEFVDKYAIGLTNYSVVGVTTEDQSDIKSKGHNVKYRRATIVTLDSQNIQINKRLNSAYEVSTTIEANINNAQYLGDTKPTHYPGQMRLKKFDVSFYDEQRIAESLLGNVVFYADNFGNGGFCMVTNYSKTDNYIRDMYGNYANETSLTLEITNYEDSIEYPI